MGGVVVHAARASDKDAAETHFQRTVMDLLALWPSTRPPNANMGVGCRSATCFSDQLPRRQNNLVAGARKGRTAGPDFGLGGAEEVRPSLRLCSVVERRFEHSLDTARLSGLKPECIAVAWETQFFVPH
jgi:hypothetical protein